MLIVGNPFPPKLLSLPAELLSANRSLIDCVLFSYNSRGITEFMFKLQLQFKT